MSHLARYALSRTISSMSFMPSYLTNLFRIGAAEAAPSINSMQGMLRNGS
jgi:hypothetical protein